MTKIRNDILLQSLSRKSGQQGPIPGTNAAGRPIVNIPFSAEERNAVSLATAEAQEAASTVYEDIAVKTDSAMLRPEYIVQSVDVFRGAEIHEVDPGDWHGEAGQVIRLHVQDESSKPIVVIADGEGRVIEQGFATYTEGDTWTYTTLAPATDGPRLIVTTRELPEHLMEVRFGT